MSFPIKPVPAKATLDLRHKVLWPNKPPAFSIVTGDESASHFAAFDDQTIVGVVSLFDVEGGLQLRKLAAAPEYQGKGIGSALVQRCLDHANHIGAARIILNGRVSAHPFYLKLGFKPFGAEYLVESEPCQMMEYLL